MPENKTFEESLNELTKTVELLENGDVSLDDAVKLFEKGIKISKECYDQIEKAEQKIKILTEEKDGFSETDFDLQGES